MNCLPLGDRLVGDAHLAGEVKLRHAPLGAEGADHGPEALVAHGGPFVWLPGEHIVARSVPALNRPSVGRALPLVESESSGSKLPRFDVF